MVGGHDDSDGGGGGGDDDADDGGGGGDNRQVAKALKDLLRQGVHLHGQEGVCIHRWGDRAHQGGGTHSGKSSQIAQKFTFSLFGQTAKQKIIFFKNST